MRQAQLMLEHQTHVRLPCSTSISRGNRAGGRHTSHGSSWCDALGWGTGTTSVLFMCLLFSRPLQGHSPAADALSASLVLPPGCPPTSPSPGLCSFLIFPFPVASPFLLPVLTAIGPLLSSPPPSLSKEVRADTGLGCVLAATFLLSSRFSYGRSWSLSELSSDEMSLWRLKGNREEGGFHSVCVFPSLASPRVPSFSRQNSRARETRLHSIQIAVPCF